ncbi:MAG TPA: alpha-E domain-containing protein, partial [Steroidobacteraceae bacterium]
AEMARSDARETLDSLLLSLAAIAGFALDDMTQDDGWRLMMIGRRLERLQFLADLISQRLVSEGTPLRQELEWILEIGDSAITYRTRYRAPPVWDTTIELLVYDERNPRALAFQWRAINTLLIEVAESLGSKPQETLYEAVSKLVTFKYTNLGGELGLGQGSRNILAQHLNDLMSASAQLSDQLASQHFSHIDFELRAVSA